MKRMQKSIWGISFLFVLLFFANSRALAQVPTSGTTCDNASPYTGTFIGNLTISGTQNCIFQGGGVTGNVQLNGGYLELDSAQVTGNLEQDGGSLSLSSTTVTKNLQITGVPTFSIQSSIIGGNLQIQNDGGDAAKPQKQPKCAAQKKEMAAAIDNTKAGENQICDTSVNGNLQFHNNTNPVAIVTSTIGRNLQVQDNSAATDIEGNTVHGNLEVTNNTMDTSIDNNTVGGNLQNDNNNTPDQVDLESNTITKNLQCHNNSAGTYNNNNTVGGNNQCYQ